jgi:hypothetical protein
MIPATRGFDGGHKLNRIIVLRMTHFVAGENKHQ